MLCVCGYSDSRHVWLSKAFQDLSQQACNASGVMAKQGRLTRYSDMRHDNNEL